MKASEQKIITAFLGKTLNMPTEKVAELFKKNGEEEELQPEALDALLKEDALRVKTFKDENQTHFENGQKKATKEFGTNRDKEIKTKYGIDSDKIGLDLVEEILTKKLAAETLDAEKVKSHPEYLKLEKDADKKAKDIEAALNKKFEDREKELAAEKTFTNVLSDADKHLAVIKPILPKDAERAKNQKKLLEGDLKGFTYQDIDGQRVVFKPDGKRLEDLHGKPISFEELVKQTAAKYWDFETGESRQGSGADNDGNNGNNSGGAKNKWAGEVPKNDDEFSREFNKLTGAENAEKRVQLLDAYESSKKV